MRTDWNADDYPWVEMPPVADDEAVMAFDRATCAAGTKQYLRRMDPVEVHALPACYRGHLVDSLAVVVSEVRPGVRARGFLNRVAP